MYRFKSVKYLSATGIITALLLVVGLVSFLFFSWVLGLLGGMSTLQLFDALFIPFCAIFKGPMMLFAGPIAGAIFDLISGVKVVVIPATILLRVLMFFVIKLLITKKWWSSIYAFLAATIILMFGYPLYYVIIFQDKAIVISELIADSIQGAFSFVVSVPLYYSLYKMQVNNHFWNDSQFDYLKSDKSKKLKKVYDEQENVTR